MGLAHFKVVCNVFTPFLRQALQRKGRGPETHVLHDESIETFFWYIWDPNGVQWRWKTLVTAHFFFRPKNDANRSAYILHEPDVPDLFLQVQSNAVEKMTGKWSKIDVLPLYIGFWPLNH